MIRPCREHGNPPEGYAFPVSLEALEAVRSALSKDWAAAFLRPTAIEELVTAWLPEFSAARKAHQTPLAAIEFDAVVGMLLYWLPSPRLREMFTKEIEHNLARISGRVTVPTSTWLSALNVIEQYAEARGMEKLREPLAESLLAEFAGEPVDDSGLNARQLPMELEWRIDGAEASEDEVRALPRESASRVGLLVNGDPVEPRIFATHLVPYRAIDEALHMAVGPYVPSVAVPSAELVARGRPLLDQSWPTNALGLVLDVRLEWAYFLPHDVALLGNAEASADAVRAELQQGRAVLCCREDREAEDEYFDDGDSM